MKKKVNENKKQNLGTDTQAHTSAKQLILNSSISVLFTNVLIMWIYFCKVYRINPFTHSLTHSHNCNSTTKQSSEYSQIILFCFFLLFFFLPRNILFYVFLLIVFVHFSMPFLERLPKCVQCKQFCGWTFFLCSASIHSFLFFFFGGVQNLGVCNHWSHDLTKKYSNVSHISLVIIKANFRWRGETFSLETQHFKQSDSKQCNISFKCVVTSKTITKFFFWYFVWFTGWHVVMTFKVFDAQVFR